MTVLDRLRDLTAPMPDAARWPAWAVGAASGALAAGITLALALAVGVSVWLAAADATASWSETLGISSALWLLGAGAVVQVDATVLGFAPLGYLLGAVALLAWLTRVAMRAVDDPGDDVLDGLPRVDAIVASAAAAGYAAISLVALALSSLGALAPRPSSMLVPVVALPVGAALLGLLLEVRSRGDLPLVLDAARVPVEVRLATALALRGLLWCLALGMGLVLALVLAHLDQVRQAHAALGAGAVGGTVVVGVQLLAWPNLGLWALSFLAGPGFAVADAATTSWAGTSGSALPAIPALAALPDPGPFPGLTRLVVVVPILVGVIVGRRAHLVTAGRTTAPSASRVALAAALLMGASVAALDLLGGHTLGAQRLAQVGAPTLLLAAAITAEVALGAVVTTSLRRRRAAG